MKTFPLLRNKAESEKEKKMKLVKVMKIRARGADIQENYALQHVNSIVIMGLARMTWREELKGHRLIGNR